MPVGVNMNIIEKYLSMNQYSRSGRGLVCCKAVILHYVGIPAQRAITTWDFFERDCPRDKHYSSVHYIIDLNGDIYHAVPDNEIAYHCGSSAVDPASGKIYTDWARRKFGHYVVDPTKNSPNNCTIGIELCIDANGNFTPETINAAVELVSKLIEKNNLTVDDVGTHKRVVGWKDCPLPWDKSPELFDEFKDCVRAKLGVLI
jgi:N-acetylmuramoyl-L-alanine amidase